MEILISVGNFSFDNSENQKQLSRGTDKHTIVYKLAKLPQEFYSNNFLMREILFPTILNVVFNC